MNPIRIFVHLPKTGGHSVARMFVEAGLEDDVHFRSPADPLGATMPVSPEKKYLVGHCAAHQEFRGIDRYRPRRWATLLREPTERLRRHWSRQRQGDIEKDRGHTLPSKEEFCRKFGNVSCDWLTKNGTPQETIEFISDPWVVWGFTKEMDKFRIRLNWAWGTRLPMVPPTHTGSGEFEDELPEEMVQEFTERDREVWEWAIANPERTY